MDMHSPDPFSRVYSVQVGKIKPLGAEGVPSGFVKSGVAGTVHVARLGIAGDQQADLTVHGGPDKAVYCYPFEHYARWLDDVPHHELALAPGGFGENLTTLGLDESIVSIGDVFRIGTVEVQVTQPRQPCFKLGLRFADNRMGRIMMQSGRTGWYFRVLRPGELLAGSRIQHLHHPVSAWTISRFNEFILSRRENRQDLIELAALEGLAAGWRQRAREALAHSPTG